MLREIRKNYRRLVAFMLTVAMTFTNIGTNLNVAFAAGEDVDALFLVDGSDLEEAIQDAVESGDTFDFSSLELTAKTKSLKTSYEKLMGGKNGAAYQLDVDVDDSYAPEGTSMEVFYNAGTEDVVFLFINESDLVVRFRANVDGYETAGVTINPNAANVDDSEASYVEDYSSTTMIDDTSKKISGEVLNPTTEAAEETTEAGEQTEAAEVEESEAAEETNAEDVSSEETEEGAVEETAEQTGEVSEEETAEVETEKAVTEAETEAAVEEAAEAAEETEAPAEEEELPEEGAAVASVSLHKIQQVASNVEVLDDADIVIETEDVPLAEEPEITEDSSVEIEDEAEAEEETEAESEIEVEAEAEETAEAAEETSEEDAVDVEIENTDAATDDTETENVDSTEAADEETAADEIAEETPVKVEETAPVATDSNADSDHTSTKLDDEQLLEDDITENAMTVLGELDGKALNTVTIWGSANARAFKVALEDLPEIGLTEEIPVEVPAVLTINYLVEMTDPESGDVLYQEIQESTVISDELFVGDEIDVADYVQDFSAEGLTYRADQETLVLEEESVLNLVYTLPENAFEVTLLDLEKPIYTVNVYYVYENNQSTRISSDQYEEGEEFRVKLPEMEGYDVVAQDENGDELETDGGYAVGIVESDMTIMMMLTPAEVSYVVKHMLQNVDGTSYEEPDENSNYYEVKTGRTDEETEAEVKDIAGFTPQAYVQKTIAGDGTTVVEIRYDRDQVSLSYNVDGGSYVARQFAKAGATVQVSNVIPTKTGYTFEGWYDGDTLVEGGSELVLNDNKILTARWRGNTVNYQIVYFQQQNDNSYKAVETKTGLTAAAGSTVAVEAGSSNAPSNKFAYYHFAKADEAVIAGDGSTSINVYYDLNVYTLSFTLSGATNASSMTFKATGTTTYSFTARLGDNILAQWPADDEINPYVYTDRRGNRTTYYWYSWNPPVGTTNYRSKRDVLESEMIPADLKFTDNGIISYDVAGTTTSSGTNKVTYKLQTVEAAKNGQYDNRSYYETEPSLTTMSSSNGMSQKELFGFSPYANLNEEEGERNWYGEIFNYTSQTFYYRRHIYELQLTNVGAGVNELWKNYDVPYQAALEEYLESPSKPNDIPAYYKFSGWYANPQGAGDPIDPKTATMPGFAQNGSTYYLYGVWKPVTIQVSFDTDGGSLIASQNIDAGTLAIEPESPEKEGYDFDGWYVSKAADAEYFRFDQPLTEDTVVYAKWKVKTVVNYTIEYVDEEGNVLAPSVTKQGIVGTRVSANAIPINGYVAQNNTLSIESLSSSGNVITFIYHQPQEKEYFVRYYYVSAAGETTYIGDASRIGSALEGSTVYVYADVVPEGWTLDDVTRKSWTITSGDNYVYFKVSRDFEITLTGYEGTYDGLDHGIGVTAPEADGYTVEYAESATGEWSGTAPLYKDVTNGSKEVFVKVTDTWTGIYKTSSAVVQITPATLTVTTQSATKEYDGTPLTADGSYTGLVAGETVGFEITGSQTEEGTSKNTYRITWEAEGNTYTAKESNYTVSENLGELSVTEITAQITVITTGGTFTYDGKAHGATVEVKGLPEGYSVETAASNATATNVTATAVPATCDELVILNANGVNVTGKLNITYTSGNIVITPAVLTVTTPTASKVYDGEPLTAEGSITGFVNGESATFTTTGTRTAVGTSDNTYSLVWDKTAVESNYEVNATIGKLTVTESTDEIVVTTTGGEFIYDGQAHGANVSVSPLPAGYTLVSATSDDMATDVEDGTVTANCDTLVIHNAAGEDVTSKLQIRYADGTIKINPATLTVTTPDAEKTYDGTALTAAGEIKGFVNDETATFATTGTQTEVGSSKNTYSLTWDRNAKESNYIITESIGTLKVNEYMAQIIVTTTGGEFTYDGQVHKATVNVSTLPSGYTVERAESNDFAIDVTDGTVTADCDELVIKNAQGIDVTDKLNIHSVTDTIKINPAKLTIVTPNASKTYDGTALTAAGTINGFVNNEKASFTTTGTQTAVGDSKNTYSLVWDSTAKAGNYTISESIGTLTVTENTAEIIVTTIGGEFIYDGQAHGASVSVSTLPTGYRLEKAESNDTATNVAEGIVTAMCDTLIIRNVQGEDVTDKLNIKYVDGTIEIKPATLTVETPNANKVYDGTALTAEGTIKGFVNNETADFKTTGSQTEVGDSKNTYSLTWNGTAAESNYTVAESIGTLIVTENTDEIVVTTTGGKFTYDGQVHGASVSVSTLPTGYWLDIAKSNDTAANVADGIVTADCDELIIRNAAGEDVTSQLNITYVNDTIEIIPATLSIVTPNASKVYDGTALTAEGTIGGFVNDEIATFTTTGSQTAVGDSENTYSLVWDGTAVKSNYTINESIGTLSVTESTAEIVVTTKGGMFTYDGHTHKAEVSVSTLPTGYIVRTASSNDQATNVSEGTVTADCDELVIENAAGEDVTDKLNITYKNDTIQIIPAELKVTTPDASKEYDGKALTAAGTISGFVNGEDATFATTGSQTMVGDSTNTYSLKWDKTAVESNYTVKEELGRLSVTESTAPITVTTIGGTFTYDGKEHGATVSVSTLPTGYTLVKASSDDTATNVAEGTVEATCDTLEIQNAEGENVTDKLNISYVNGSITITPAPLTIKTPSDSKVYDGTALTAAGTISGLVNGETADFTTTGSQTRVGSSKNTYSLKWTGTAEESNYAISESLGTLTVTQNSDQIVVTTTGGTFTYDGQAHGATVSVSTLPAGYRLDTAKSNDTATNVLDGTVEANCDELIIRNEDGEDVTNELNILYVNGSITITPATLTISTPSASKVYDGTALTAEGTIQGFVNGETATFNTTGSQTAVGSSQNTYQVTWDGNAVESNYTISANTGVLLVSEYDLPITVTTTGGTFTYDGQEHSATVRVSTLPTGYRVETASSRTTATDVTNGALDATCDTLIILNAADEDVTEKLNIEYVNDTLQVNPAQVVVITYSDTKTYDGTPLTASGRIDGLVNGETVGLTLTGTQTLVGSSDNTYEIIWAPEMVRAGEYTAKKSNYVVTEQIGVLTVTSGTPEDPVDPDKVVTKIHENMEYDLGDTVTYTISVTNIYDKVQTITIVEQDGVTITGESVFKNVQPGETVNTTATYTITEADILAGEYKNTVTAKFDDEEFSNDDTVDPVDPKGWLKIVKTVTSTPKNGKTYALDETITYEIVAYNRGNVTLTNVKVMDELTGKDWTISALMPDQKTVVLPTEYMVTEKDILKGSVLNKATGTAETPENVPDLKIDPGEAEVPTDPKNSHITIVKETTSKPANGKAYELGETVTYRITAINDGNLTLDNVKVRDALTGDNWTILTLAPGESKFFDASYEVTEENVLNGSVYNKATASSATRDPEKPEPDVTPGETDDPVETSKPSLHVEKTAEQKEGGYKPGDEIKYTITVTNNGNVTIHDIDVVDDLTGKTWHIGKLTPGKTSIFDKTYKVFETTYTVTEEDVLNRENHTIVNTATATGKDPEGNEVQDEGKKEIAIQEPKRELDVQKIVTSDPKTDDGKYAIGQTIQYKITVTNAGNITLENIRVDDISNGAGKVEIKPDGWFGTSLFASYEIIKDGEAVYVNIPSLAPEKSVEIQCTYVVVKEDNGNIINNRAAADGGDSEEDPKDEDDVDVEVKQTYDIYVKHVFAEGDDDGITKLPADYVVENHEKGYHQSFTPESVKGYTAHPAVQNVTLTDSDVDVVFVYFKDTIGTDPENPDKPDNIPDKYQITFTYVSEDTAKGTVTGTTKEVRTLYEFEVDPSTGTVTRGEQNTVMPKAAVTVKAADKFAFDFWSTPELSNDYSASMRNLASLAYTQDTIFTAHFDKDEIGNNPEKPDDPHNPDGIPDKYQIVFTYKSADTTMGTVSGTVCEVVTRERNADGSLKAAKPSAQVTAAGATSRYSLTRWTAGESEYANLDAIRAAEFTEDTTFTANWKRNSSGGGNSPGGGSGSGPKGGGSSTSGPGVPTTTIDPDAVPLASLPTDNSEILSMIDDEDVPLAALPKTGQSGGASLMLMLSSMMLAAFAVVTRKKEDKQ